MEFGLINYRAAISQALELGFRGAFLCEHYGSDAITVIGQEPRVHPRHPRHASSTDQPDAEGATMTSDSHHPRPRRLPERRTAVITGAGGPAGIGRVTARMLAENGWHVALVDINADGLAAVETELREAGS